MMIIIMGSAAAIFSIATSVKEGLEKLVTQGITITAVVVRMHVKKTTFSITFCQATRLGISKKLHIVLNL